MLENMSGQEQDENSEDAVERIEFENLEAFVKNGLAATMEAVRHANALPIGRDFDFYKTHESFRRITNVNSDNLLSLTNRILQTYDVRGNVKARTFDEKTELVVECNDAIVERISTKIDELDGLRKAPSAPVVQTVTAVLPVNGSWNRVDRFAINSTQGTTGENTIRLLTAKNIVRPQVYFKDKVDNSNWRPWTPRIPDKPNSLKPLALYTEETEHGEEYSHPYEFELERFSVPDDFLREAEPVRPKDLHVTPLHEITAPEQLDDLVSELLRHKEIAVDLEHHSYRTFLGITCLMQISTVDADYLVDTLALRDRMHVLNEVFTRGSILKIFHGADNDVLWMQRDLSLYLVNMFDTHKAAKQLGYPLLSLSHLLKRFCQFVPNKQFQLADWRIRPLPDELKSYAREDTHYLIYIYRRMKNELLRMGNGGDQILRSVHKTCTDLCGLRYHKPRLTETSHMDFYRKCKRLFDNRQMYALKELYRWRDETAREEDESTGYVLPNHMLLQISETLPREIQGILACCNPIPPLVRANSLELHKIILRAREQPLQKAIMKEENRRGATKESNKLNMDSPLHCPHDFARQHEFRDDLPTLLEHPARLNKACKANDDLSIERRTSSCSIFSAEETVQKVNVSSLSFLGPYERYKLVKPFVQAEEEKKAAEEEATPNLASDDPPVADRIASLHKHFMQVSRDLSVNRDEEEPPSSSLIAQGASKKRKRHFSPTGQPQKAPKINLHVPVPSWVDMNIVERDVDEMMRNQQGQGKPKKRKNRPQNRGGGGHGTPQNRDGGGLGTPQQRNSFRPYDYSNVDFGQFQGGGGRAAPVPFNTNFRGKGKRKNFGGKPNNRSFTFGGDGGGKRGRGRK